MARPSKIDRLPNGIQQLIADLRHQGRGIDEILAKLRELVPPEEQPSRSGMGRHIQRIDVLAKRVGVADAMADRLVGTGDEGAIDRMVRAGARALGAVFFDLVSAEENGEPVTIEPKDAKMLSEVLRNISQARRMDIETVARGREEGRKAALAEQKAKFEEMAASGTLGNIDPKALTEARRAMGWT